MCSVILECVRSNEGTKAVNMRLHTSTVMGCILTILMIMTVLTGLGMHGEHISTQNYGYKLQKKGQALITTGQVRLTHCPQRASIDVLQFACCTRDSRLNPLDPSSR